MFGKLQQFPTYRKWAFGRWHGRKYSPIAMYATIEGWLDYREALQLFDLAESISSPSPVVVELGSWKGKSSVVISHALAGKPGAKLYCIDPFNADGDADSVDHYQFRQANQPYTLREIFDSNVRKYGNASVVEALLGYSTDKAEEWDKPVDMLFIDANHEYEAALRDFQDWVPFIKPGGILAMHDVKLEWPNVELSGPARVVRENTLASDQWEDHHLATTLYSARRK